MLALPENQYDWEWKRIEDGMVESLESDDYQIDWEEVYRNALDCVVEGNGDVNLEQPLDGSIPRCFFNLPIFEGDWNDADLVWNNEPVE